MTPDPADQRRAARNLARRATFDLARAAGAETITRPAFAGAQATVSDVDPLAGLTASRRVELAAREHAVGYIRAAREAGHTWHDIGTALDLVPGGDAQQAGESVAEAAFTYAVGHPDTEHARRYGRSVAWTCRSCDRAISDHGLCNGPADDEVGHTDNCPRLAATIDAWDAEWEAIEADWEAGQ
jgi:hypothetical protein